MAEDKITTEESTDQLINRQALNRRSFLKKGAIAGIGVAALYAAPKMSTTRAAQAFSQITGAQTPTPGPDPTPELRLEIDEFDDAEATLQIHLAHMPGFEVVNLIGPATIHAMIGLPGGETVLTDGAGHDMIETEIVAMELTGHGPLGPTTLRVMPAPPSVGRITETTNFIPGILDLPPFGPGTANSFFDVFFEVDVGGLILQAERPMHIESTVSVKPAGDETFTVFPYGEAMPLLDPWNAPMGMMILDSLVFNPAPG